MKVIIQSICRRQYSQCLSVLFIYLFFSLSITINLLFFTRLGRTVARRTLAFLSSQRVVVLLYEDVAFITGPIARGLERGNRAILVAI